MVHPQNICNQPVFGRLLRGLSFASRKGKDGTYGWLFFVSVCLQCWEPLNGQTWNQIEWKLVKTSQKKIAPEARLIPRARFFFVNKP